MGRGELPWGLERLDLGEVWGGLECAQVHWGLGAIGCG